MIGHHIKFSICIEILIAFLSFGFCQNNETCNYKRSHCKALVRHAFRTYPNYRDKRTVDLIKMFGYPAENHETTTEDGYILSLQRIPYSNISGPSSDKIPVFCMHGGFSSSAQWFWQPANRALVFMLADAGYDVWIGNSRGTTYSQKHVSLPVNDPNDLRYWNFSQHEYAKFDVPANIHYITNHTGQASIYWIGHSIGAGQFFMSMGMYPELNSKIRTMFAMAPAAYSGNATNKVYRIINPIYSQFTFQQFANEIGGGKVLPELLANLLKPLIDSCRVAAVDCGLCSNLLFLTLGFSCQLNITTLPGLVAHVPDTISTKTQSHYSQWMETGEFRQYDYGNSLLNARHYGRSTPPDYNWSNIKVPVVIYCSDGDTFVDPKDARKTGAALGSNLKELNLVPYPHFSHLDFVAGIDGDRLVYKKIIKVMDSRKYEPAHFIST